MKRALFCASMLGGLVAAASAAAAPVLPSGGRVVAGSAAISSPTGSALTISQSSSRAVIDWTSFGVGQGGAVRFDNGSGATLNRVTGANVSSIDGLLSATGSVYLINPNGVIVGKSGVINTGGTFVASTLDVANASFLAGGPLSFSGASSASVVNLGKVSSLGGNVAMIAATVSNAGSIAAPKGDVGLIAGTTVTMDDSDNDAGGLFSVQVGDGSTSATNAGAIAAAAVELRAQQGNVYALAGNTGGVIDATGVDVSGGVIKLISTGGATSVSGTLSAQGANGTGGQIETSGATLDLGAASVNTHGGSWLLDPTNLIINSTAASAIDKALASGSVTLATSASAAPTETGVTGATGYTASGAGDIIVEHSLTWSSASTLTLDAHAALIIDAPITVTGAGKVVLDFSPAAADAPGGLSFDLGPSGFAGSLSYAVGTGEGIAGQALTINKASYTLAFTLSQLASDIAAAPSGDYALASHSVAGTNGGAGYTEAVIPSLSGTLEGLGNTVSGLTINGGSTDAAGLIGQLKSGGLVRDLGLVGGAVSGSNNVGDLVGASAGTVETTYATGAVSGSSTAFGGLVGFNSGTVEASYATGAVSGSGFYEVGGLVGENEGTVETSYATGPVSGFSLVGGLVGMNFGSVETSYATGAASASGLVGGLVGETDGPVETSYATGAVSGSSYAGGLVGIIYSGGEVSKSYWDIDTTSQSGAETGATGLTTAQLQSNFGGYLTNLGASFGGGTGGLYPYLIAFYPTKPQAISGFAYESDGGAASAAQVGLYEGGSLLGGGPPISGANGYFYELVAGGTVGASTKLGETITLSGASDASGLTYTDQPTLNAGNVVGLDVSSGATNETTADTSLSVLNADLASTFGSGYTTIASQLGADSDMITASGASGFTVNQSLSPGGNLSITTTSGNLTITGTVNATGHTLTLTSAGALNASAGILEATVLTGSAKGAATLGGHNEVATLDAFTDTAGAVSINDASALSIAGLLDAGANTLTLTDGSTIAEVGSGGIVAGALTGSAKGAATLGGHNEFATLDAFTDTAGAVSINDASALSIAGLLDAGANTLTLTDGSTLAEVGSGEIVAGALTGSAKGAATLGGHNEVATLDAFTDTAGAVSINDASALSIAGLLDAGANTLTLTDGSTLAEVGSGEIVAGALTGSAKGAATLGGHNEVATLDAFTDTAGAVSINDASALSIAGLLDAGANTLTLTDGSTLAEVGSGEIVAGALTGSAKGAATLRGHNEVATLDAFTDTAGAVSINDASALSIAGLLDAGANTLTLTDGSTIAEVGSGEIVAGALTGSAKGAATLGGANEVATLDAFTDSATGVTVTLTDDQALRVTGPLNVRSGTVSLTTKSGNVTVAGVVAAETLTLDAAGEALETSTGAIDAGTINVTAQTGIDLDSSSNAISAIGVDKTTAGSNVIDKQ